MNHTRALLVDAAERIGTGWWYIAGLGLFGFLSAAVWPVGERRTVVAGAMTAAVMLGAFIPVLTLWPAELNRLPMARRDAWRTRLIMAASASAGVTLVVGLGFAVSGSPVVEPALKTLGLCLLLNGAVFGAVALIEPMAMAVPTRRTVLIVLLAMVAPHLHAWPPAASSAFAGVAALLSVVAVAHRPPPIGLETIKAGRDVRFRLLPAWLQGLPLLFVTDTAFAAMLAAFMGTAFIGMGLLDGSGRKAALGIAGVFQLRGDAGLPNVWILFQPIAIWEVHRRIRQMRVLPLSTPGLALTLLALQASQTIAVWAAIIVVAGAWTGQWPTSIRPELLSLTVGLASAAGFAKLLTKPGSVGASSVVSMITALVTGLVVMSFAGGASPVAYVVLCLMGACLTLASFLGHWHLLQQRGDLYRPTSPPVRT